MGILIRASFFSLVTVELTTINAHQRVSTNVQRANAEPIRYNANAALMTNGSLMKVESIAECSPLEHSAILLTCIKHELVLKTNFGILEWPF